MKETELVITIPEEIRLALINNIKLSIDQQSICDSCIKQAIINGTIYETRLKTDMIDMLEEMQSEIETTVKEEELVNKKWTKGLHYFEKIIQQKINSLKEDTDEKK